MNNRYFRCYQRSINNLMATALGISTCLSVSALPTGGNVVDGQANITNNNNYMQINQSSNQALINWQTFNIGASEHVHFNQPGVNSLTINRINPANGASGIYGHLSATGQIFLLNPAGVIFGNGAHIDVAGILASTSDINLDAYFDGRLEFIPNYNYDGSIINNGNISIKDSGYAAFVAPHVVNNGVIYANLGHVQLSSGDAYTVDLYGDQLINFKVPEDKAKTISRNYEITNSGKIYADGGRILMTSADVNDVITSVINMDGYAQANTVYQQDGQIIFSSGKLGSLNFAANSKIKASEGHVIARGGNINLASGSEIDVSSDNINGNGGSVTIGGNYQGLRFSVDDYNALNLNMEQGAKIFANAGSNGNGGGIVLWSDNLTNVAGEIKALGGIQSGNGGFIETSSKRTLNLLPGLNVSAAAQNNLGLNGEWLLDPSDLYIHDIAAIALSASLQSGNDIRITTEQFFVEAASFGTPIYPTTIPIYDCPGLLGSGCTGVAGQQPIVTAVDGNHGAWDGDANDDFPADPDNDVGFGNVYFNNDNNPVQWTSNASFTVEAGGSIFFNVDNAIISNGLGDIKLFAALRPEVHNATTLVDPPLPDRNTDMTIGLIYQDDTLTDAAVKSTNGGLIEAYIRPYDKFGQPSDFVLINGVSKYIDQNTNDFITFTSNFTTAASKIYQTDSTSQFIEYHWINYDEAQHTGAELRTLSNAAAIANTLNATNSFDSSIGFALFNDVDLAVADPNFTGFNEYRGHFDGLNRTLSNFDLTDTRSIEGNAGFFKTLNGNQTSGMQYIKNLSLDNFDIEFTASSSDRNAIYGGGALVGQLGLDAAKDVYFSNITIDNSSVVALPYNNGSGIYYPFRSSAGLLVGTTTGVGAFTVDNLTTGYTGNNLVDSFYIGSHVIGQTTANQIILNNLNISSLSPGLALSVMIDDVNALTTNASYENSINENSYLGGIIGRTTNQDLSLTINNGLLVGEPNTAGEDVMFFEIRNLFPDQATFAGGLFGDFIGSSLVANGAVGPSDVYIESIILEDGIATNFGNKQHYMGGIAGRAKNDAQTLDIYFQDLSLGEVLLSLDISANDNDFITAYNTIGGAFGEITANTVTFDSFYTNVLMNVQFDGLEIGNGFESNVSGGIAKLNANQVDFNGSVWSSDYNTNFGLLYLNYSNNNIFPDDVYGIEHEILNYTIQDTDAEITLRTAGLLAHVDATEVNIGNLDSGRNLYTNLETSNLSQPAVVDIFSGAAIAEGNISTLTVDQLYVYNGSGISNGRFSENTTNPGIDNMYSGGLIGYINADSISFAALSFTTTPYLNVTNNSGYSDSTHTINTYLGGVMAKADITSSLTFGDIAILNDVAYNIDVGSTAIIHPVINYNSYLSAIAADVSGNNLIIDFTAGLALDMDLYNNSHGFNFNSLNTYTGPIFGKVAAQEIDINYFEIPSVAGGGGPEFTILTSLDNFSASNNNDINIYNGGLIGHATANILNFNQEVIQSEVTKVQIDSSEVLNYNNFNIFNSNILAAADVNELNFYSQIIFNPWTANAVYINLNSLDQNTSILNDNIYNGSVIGKFNGDRILFTTAFDFATQFEMPFNFGLVEINDQSPYTSKTRNIYLGGLIADAQFTDNITFERSINLAELYTSVLTNSSGADSITETTYVGGLIAHTNSETNNNISFMDEVALYISPFDFNNVDSNYLFINDYFAQTEDYFFDIGDYFTYNQYIINHTSTNSNINTYFGGIYGKANHNSSLFDTSGLNASPNLHISSYLYGALGTYIEKYGTGDINVYIGGLAGQGNTNSTVVNTNISLDLPFYNEVYDYPSNTNNTINLFAGALMGDSASSLTINVPDGGYINSSGAANYFENESPIDNSVGTLNVYTSGLIARTNNTNANIEINGDIYVDYGYWSDIWFAPYLNELYVTNLNTQVYTGGVFGQTNHHTTTLNGDGVNSYPYIAIYDNNAQKLGTYLEKYNLGTINSYIGGLTGQENATNLNINTAIYIDHPLFNEVHDSVADTSNTVNLFAGGLIGDTSSESITINVPVDDYIYSAGNGNIFSNNAPNDNSVGTLNAYAAGLIARTNNPTMNFELNGDIEIDYSDWTNNVEGSFVSFNSLAVNNANIHAYSGGLFGQTNHNTTTLNGDGINPNSYIHVANASEGAFGVSIVKNNLGSITSYLGGLAGQDNSNSFAINTNINFEHPFYNEVYDYLVDTSSTVNLFTAGLIADTTSNITINVPEGGYLSSAGGANYFENNAPNDNSIGTLNAYAAGLIARTNNASSDLTITGDIEVNYGPWSDYWNKGFNTLYANNANLQVYSGGFIGQANHNSTTINSDGVATFPYMNIYNSISDATGTYIEKYNLGSIDSYIGGFAGQDNSNTLEINTALYLDTPVFHEIYDYVNDTSSTANLFAGGLIGDSGNSNITINIPNGDYLSSKGAANYLLNYEPNDNSVGTINLYAGGLIGRTSATASDLTIAGDIEVDYGQWRAYWPNSSLNETDVTNADIQAYSGGIIGQARNLSTNLSGDITVINSNTGSVRSWINLDGLGSVIAYTGGIYGSLTANSLQINGDLFVGNNANFLTIYSRVRNNNSSSQLTNVTTYTGGLAGMVDIANTIDVNGVLDFDSLYIESYYDLASVDLINSYNGMVFGFENAETVNFNNDLYIEYHYPYFKAIHADEANQYIGSISGLSLTDNINFAENITINTYGAGGEFSATDPADGIIDANIYLGGLYGAIHNPLATVNINSPVNMLNHYIDYYVYGISTINNGNLNIYQSGLIGSLDVNSITLNGVNVDNPYIYLDINDRVYTSTANNQNNIYLGGVFGYTSPNVADITFNDQLTISLGNNGDSITSINLQNANINSYVGGIFGQNNATDTTFNNNVYITSLNLAPIESYIANTLGGNISSYAGGISGSDNISSLTFNGTVTIDPEISNSIINTDAVANDSDINNYTGGISGHITAANILFNNDITVASVTASSNLTEEGDNEVSSNIYLGGLFGISSITSPFSQHLDNGVVTIGGSAASDIISGSNQINANGGLYVGGLFGLLDDIGTTEINSDVNIFADIQSTQDSSAILASSSPTFTPGLFTGGLIGLQNNGLTIINSNVTLNGNVDTTSGFLAPNVVQASGGIYGGLVNSSFIYDDNSFTFANLGTTASSSGYTGGVIGYIDILELDPADSDGVSTGITAGQLLFDSPNEAADWTSTAGDFTYANAEPCQGPSAGLCSSEPSVTIPETQDPLTTLLFDITTVEQLPITTLCDQIGEAGSSSCIAQILGNITDSKVYVSVYETITDHNTIVISGYPYESFSAKNGDIDLNMFTLKRYDGEFGHNHPSGSFYVLTPIK